MGLSNFAVVQVVNQEYLEEDEDVWTLEDKTQWIKVSDDYFKVGIHLIECNNEASFRGKCYRDYIEDVTGMNIKTMLIDNNRVNIMAIQLEKHAQEIEQDPKQFCNFMYEADNVETSKNLAKWFRVCADNGFSLLGDY